MQTLYKYITAALAFAGCGSLLITGELNPVFVFPGIAIIPGYYRYIRGMSPLSRWLIAGIALLEIAVLGFDAMFVSSDFLIAIAHMTIVFQALKSFDMREPWDPLQVYFMSILQIIITSELSLSIIIGVVYVVFILIFMAAMVLSHFMKEGTLDTVRFFRPLVLISVAAIALTLVFFIAVPRVSGGLWGRKADNGLRTVGFSDRVDLGTYGEVLQDESIAMRVELSGQRLPLYWRGMVLDEFNGTRWSNTIQSSSRLRSSGRLFRVSENKTGARTSTQKIVLEPMDTELLFGLGRILTVRARGWILVKHSSGGVSLPGKNNRRITYTVVSAEDNGIAPVAFSTRDRHLELPGGMEKIKALASDITASSTGDFQRAASIAAYLRGNFSYTLNPPRAPVGVSPMDWFIFESRQGYCEHFATAMALMLRTQGIPSRIVTGFMGGEENEYGDYVIVRQKNAHSWVEAGIEGRWRRFDPTPVAPAMAGSVASMMIDALKMKWYRYVIGFTRYDQSAILSSLDVPVFSTPSIKGMSIDVKPYHIAIAVVVLLPLLYFTLSIRRRAAITFNSRMYLRFRRRVANKGGRVSAYSTPEEVAVEALRLDADPALVEEFMDIYLSRRFGSIPARAQDVRRLKQLSRTVI